MLNFRHAVWVRIALVPSSKWRPRTSTKLKLEFAATPIWMRAEVEFVLQDVGRIERLEAVDAGVVLSHRTPVVLVELLLPDDLEVREGVRSLDRVECTLEHGVDGRRERHRRRALDAGRLRRPAAGASAVPALAPPPGPSAASVTLPVVLERRRTPLRIRARRFGGLDAAPRPCGASRRCRRRFAAAEHICGRRGARRSCRVRAAGELRLRALARHVLAAGLAHLLVLLDQVADTTGRRPGDRPAERLKHRAVPGAALEGEHAIVRRLVSARGFTARRRTTLRHCSAVCRMLKPLDRKIHKRSEPNQGLKGQCPAMGRAGLEPATLGLKVPCSTS